MWNVNIVNLGDYIKHYKSNKIIIKNLQNFIEDLKTLPDDENPRDYADRKQGQWNDFYGHHLTKSISVLYRVDDDHHTVYMDRIGDHKELYRRD